MFVTVFSSIERPILFHHRILSIVVLNSTQCLVGCPKVGQKCYKTLQCVSTMSGHSFTQDLTRPFVLTVFFHIMCNVLKPGMI